MKKAGPSYGLLASFLKIIGAYGIYGRYLKGQIAKDSFPRHVGIILDGNRRWAKGKDLPTFLGHKLGAEKARNLLEWCHDLGIETITLYVLSTENLLRNEDELSWLFGVMQEKFQELLEDERLHRYRIKVKAIGKLALLPEKLVTVLRKLEKATEVYDTHFLNIAIAYGGRMEIVDAIRDLADKAAKGMLKPEEITPQLVEKHLYTAHLPNPDPDVIVRTSGEERLSGFLLWQSAYSELIFLDAYWPDFRKIDLMRAIRTYQKRMRRFGR